MDANYVPDVKLDVTHTQQNSRHHSSILHALKARGALILAWIALVYRFMKGDDESFGFIRECSAEATRKDRIISGIQAERYWLQAELIATFQII